MEHQSLNVENEHIIRARSLAALLKLDENTHSNYFTTRYLIVILFFLAMISTALAFLALSGLSAAHGDHGQLPMSGPHKGLWYNTLPGDGGTQVRIFHARSKSH